MNKFSDYKKQIEKALEKRKKALNLKEEWVLLEGCLNPPIDQHVNLSWYPKGKILPTIAVVVPNTGMIRYFALKHLLPDVDLDTIRD